MPEFKYLRPEDVQRLASYEFAPKILVEGYLSGRHRSSARGTSTEFRDYRQYADGDDPKLVDWKVFARTDRHYLRTFAHETNLDCHLFLDSSASMGFGAPLSKLDYGSFFTAALCHLVLRSADRVSLQLFDDQIRHFAPPGSTRGHLHNLMQLLENNTPGGRTRLSVALRRAYPLLRHRGSLVVVSDFFDDVGEIFAALSPYLHRGFAIHLFQVLAPEELELPDMGLQAFECLETGQRVVAHTDLLRREYPQAIQTHIRSIREAAMRRRISYTQARTDTPFLELFDRLQA
ncbi:MAG: DUF58 domain-containing protein [Opitutaceae bacterium]|nr:DUF58 domain-containing protein [Opitutaceae bacterium]